MTGTTTSSRIGGLSVLPPAACAGCAPAREPDLFEIAYGTTRHLPMIGTPAADHIGDDAEAVPAAIRRCEGSFIAFDGRVTGGGDAAYFSAADPAVATCVATSLPAGQVRPAPASLAAELRRRSRASTDPGRSSRDPTGATSAPAP